MLNYAYLCIEYRQELTRFSRHSRIDDNLNTQLSGFINIIKANEITNTLNTSGDIKFCDALLSPSSLTRLIKTREVHFAFMQYAWCAVIFEV